MRQLGCFFCWLFLIVSGATIPKPGTVPQVEMAEGEETADTGCAYFYFLWGKTAEADHHFEEALEAYEKAWQEVVEEESEDNAQFRKVYASYSKFREEFKLWGENGYLKR